MMILTSSNFRGDLRVLFVQEFVPMSMFLSDLGLHSMRLCLCTTRTAPGTAQLVTPSDQHETCAGTLTVGYDCTFNPSVPDQNVASETVHLFCWLCSPFLH